MPPPFLCQRHSKSLFTIRLRPAPPPVFPVSYFFGLLYVWYYAPLF